ncbi:MAG TPA: hypothetical protein VK760_11300 [Candidatus Acidoferrales bacterium]|jgi:hypothetical protein|nr:hypothetical protein [Candidatus Acidoferrales bacterium]
MKRLAFVGAIALSVAALLLPLGAQADFSTAGTWTCAASGEGANHDQTGHFTLSLTESNGVVIGTYYDGKASLKGTRSGNTVTGAFTEPNGTGPFSFTFSDDGSSFTGTWGTSPAGGSWSGTRQ